MVDVVLPGYHMIEKIGGGTYGEVFKAMKPNGDIVAVKKLLLNTEDDGVPSHALREISLMKELAHPQIVSLYDVVLRFNTLFLILEFMEQDLSHMLHQRDCGLSATLLKSYLRQILNGIHFCHVNRIIHRDLKPDNLLVSQNGKVIKLADFGIARALQIPLCTYTHKVMTLWYRAPEILLGDKHYGSAIDLWSIGCIFAEMSTQKPLLMENSEIGQLFEIFRVLGTPNENLWPGIALLPDYTALFPKFRPQPLCRVVGPTVDPEGIDLLAALLRLDPKQRPTAKAAQQHPYLHDGGDPIAAAG